ncbi:hypothetical protein DPMN_081897 [Dreissena polymorpha]|uniref:Uncharacterized protein n=1 Tax=Dreissena polymorpha TaxID=45954 RepID=A0A9D3Y9Q1_DREPO|nr:hypothetical protein DPMN_081897 [Dreissena polymorpha]
METSDSTGIQCYIEERIKDATFKRKSYEEQYKSNSKILENIDLENTAIESNTIQSAKEAALIEAVKTIRQRQTLILMADTSELGWRVVNEYTTNPIASESEDEKRI